MDKKEIEGTTERAADRGRAEDLGFVVTDKPSLGNPEVALALVSEFAAQVVAVRGQYLTGKSKDPKAEITELAAEYGDIIMGRDERYHALPWHNPSRLGRRIGLVIPLEDGAGDPGVQLFTKVAASLMELAVAHEGGRVSDADGEAATTAMLQDVAGLITGVR